MQSLILSKNRAEASAYALKAGIRHYRYAASAASVSAGMFGEIVELSSFSVRPDKHAINAAVKRIQRRSRVPYRVDGEWEYATDATGAPKSFVSGELEGQTSIDDFTDDVAENPEVIGAPGPDYYDGETDFFTEDVAEVAATYDEGGFMQPGLITVKNRTERAEPIRTPAQNFFDQEDEK